MSTRANVVIKKKGHKSVILYHHSDGYPEGVGKGLSFYFDEIYAREDKEEIISTPENLAKFLTDKRHDDEYEYAPCLHGDIEYLYIIDLSIPSVTCYDAWDWQDKIFSEDYDILPWVYNACIWDSFNQFSFNEDY